MTTKTKGVLLLFLAALLFSIMPVWARILGSGGQPPIAQVFLRYIIACIAAFIYFVITKQKVLIRKQDLPFLIAATVFGYALVNLFFTLGVLNTQIGDALFLFYTYAIFLPFLGAIFLKDKLNIYIIASLLLGVIALLLLFQPNSLPNWKLGAFFAFLSGICQASYLLLIRKLKFYSPPSMMLFNTSVGVITLGILSLVLEHKFYFAGGFTHVSLNTWILTVIFGIDNFFAWFCMTKGFNYFKSASGGLVLLLEIVFGIFFAALFFKEVPTIATFIGGVLILLSSTLVILKNES